MSEPEPVRTWTHQVTPPDTVWTTATEEGEIVVWSETEQEEPVPPNLCEAVRGVAWRTVGIPRNPEAALARHAKAQGLGAPLTSEFDFQYEGISYRGQGYAAGIAYCEVGQWDTVWTALW